MYSAVRSSKSQATENFKRQGSLRKVLSVTQPKDNNLLIHQNGELNKMYKGFYQEYIILAEYKMIQSENVEGVYVIPSRENPLVWFGVIFIRNGPYENGIFRFNILLDENFPDYEHPKVVFTTNDVFHPVINPETKELNLLYAFPSWNKSEQHIWQILKYMQWIFFNVEGSLAHVINKEAASLFKDNRDAFNDKVKQLVKSSQQQIYEEPLEEDKNNIIFEPYNPSIHDSARSSMLTQREDDNHSGYSWVLFSSFKPLGRPVTPDSESDL